MYRQFLCCKHRSLLSQNPDAAQATWSKGINQGKAHYDEKDLDIAIVCFGGAFEAASILLKHTNYNAADKLYKVTMAAMFLARSLHADQQAEFSRTVLEKAADLISPFSSPLNHKSGQGSEFSTLHALDCMQLIESCSVNLFGGKSLRPSNFETMQTTTFSSGDRSLLH